MYRLLLSLLLLPIISFAQIKKDYQGLLWKITGNGLEEPSYLYGTMHVSNRVAFHLSETFFNALDDADIVALETNPETWVHDLTHSKLYHDYFELSYRYRNNMPLYGSFIPSEPQQQDWEYYLARDQDLLNNLLYRLNTYEQDFAENTYLDLFIFQAGKKGGKKIVPLEDYQESYKYVLLAGKKDKDAVYITERQARELLGDFDSWQMLMEDAYRRGDLDLIDTLNTVLYPGKYHRKNMLDIRNQIMVNGMDSLMKEGVLFTGVGASHLPGKMGVINLLREMGYTVEAEERAVTSTSITRKDEIDDIIFTTETQNFQSDDDFITTIVPGKMIKFLSEPFQEYVFADMANGGFYSIRRINTFAPVHGMSAEAYRARIDSMLFENIPGKILSKEEIEVSGFPAIDVKNETRTGDHQHYQIVFTPLEAIIFKVGGHKEFAKSALPEAFFKNIKLGSPKLDLSYQPDFKGFKVNLPGDIRTEQYEAAFENPNYTFWAQSYDNGDYYSASLRQYHDFEYLEEDDFELKYFVEKMVDEEDKKLELDTLYLIENGATKHSRFIISSKKGTKIYGEVHIQGPKYVMLTTTASDEAKREAFFNSFAFDAWHYEREFQEYQDTVYHIVMKAPQDINNFGAFLSDIFDSRSFYGNDEDHSYRGEYFEKTITYPESGEQLKIALETEHKFGSYKNLEEYWKEQENEFLYEYSLKIVSDSILFTKQDSSYLSQGKLYVLSDTNTQRTIKVKMILENAALYSIWACTDTLGYTSAFADAAFESFRTADDTVIGMPITLRKADLFFEALDSRDSVRLFEASNSVYTVDFEESDAERIKSYVKDYEQEGFDRDARLNLLNQLSWLDEKHISFLEDFYYEMPDSSSYQFKILETLLDYETKEGNKVFKKLILDEPPFTSNTYSYSRIFYEFRDSLALATPIFPDILPLTDFQDYRSGIYSLLADLSDTGLIKPSVYRSKYKTLVLFAKVELKKQHAADESRNNYYGGSSSNSELLTYTRLLKPYARKKEVKEHFEKILKIRSETVLADLLIEIDPLYDIPDSTWNIAAKNDKALYDIYPYLREQNKLEVLEEKYRSDDAFAKSIMMSSRYSDYDTVSFIRAEPVDIKPYPAKAYFFRAKDEDDKLWKLLYIVVKDQEVMTRSYALSTVGETYNESLADLDEIIEDAIKDIKLYERERVD